VSHERTTNAETEVLSLTFPDGRGVRLKVIKLDKPLAGAPAGSQEQANLEEYLEPPMR
jgi:hypothetical protein